MILINKAIEKQINKGIKALLININGKAING